MATITSTRRGRARVESRPHAGTVVVQVGGGPLLCLASAETRELAKYLAVCADAVDEGATETTGIARSDAGAPAGSRCMSAALAHSNAQRAAAAAGIVARAGRRWGLLPYQVVIASSIATNAVLRQGKSAAGAVAAARRAARAQAGAA
ncbi:hypothetical protein [Stenotrophomonas pavanii]|uniref:hypothetical protein n=1 Tax=Stenotrophomonas pavanii TaxID=487698 RepID=UPI0039C68E5B